MDEENQAKESQRILRARWVLVWKPIPDEDRAEAQEKALNPDGKRKAKAHIVVMGFEHPDLLNPTFNSTAPVQSQLMRNLSLCLVAQKKWVLEGLDLTTAFLQTGRTEESREVWTCGVPELRAALSRRSRSSQDPQEHLWQCYCTSRTLGGHRQDTEVYGWHSPTWRFFFLGLGPKEPQSTQ